MASLTSGIIPHYAGMTHGGTRPDQITTGYRCTVTFLTRRLYRSASWNMNADRIQNVALHLQHTKSCRFGRIVTQDRRTVAMATRASRSQFPNGRFMEYSAPGPIQTISHTRRCRRINAPGMTGTTGSHQ